MMQVCTAVYVCWELGRLQRGKRARGTCIERSEVCLLLKRKLQRLSRCYYRSISDYISISSFGRSDAPQTEGSMGQSSEEDVCQANGKHSAWAQSSWEDEGPDSA